MPVVILVLGLIWGPGPVKKHPDQIYEKESSYNYIQVLEKNDYRFLRLNEGQGIHSIYHPEYSAYWGTWMQVLPTPFFNAAPYSPDDVNTMAIIGLAAGTSARQASGAYNALPIDGYEIDQEIILIGQEYFEMDLPNLTAIPEDGRWGLVHSGKKYSLISIDAYRPPYIPWHLTTQEFFQEVYQHLEDQGSLVLNVGRVPEEDKLLAGLVATIQTVFPSVYVIDVPGTFNSMIYATAQPTHWENLEKNLVYLLQNDAPDQTLVQSIKVALDNRRPLPEGGMIFTDDKAPIEQITNRMVLNSIMKDPQLLGGDQ
jgi:spermidine synthase